MAQPVVGALLRGGAGGKSAAGRRDMSEAETARRAAVLHEGEDETGSDGDTANGDAAGEHSNAPRWSSSGVETYAIQCNTCFKWRLIPSKEMYEVIGENILQNPFVCATARDWRDNVSCADPADLEDDEPTVLWAIDKHNIPRPPEGFYRKVVLRAENTKKFADVYYKTPCGRKTLRSMVDVQKYVDEHPELGINKAQFSFTSPKGKAEALIAGVSPKRVLKNETKFNTESSKRMKGSDEGKSPGYGQPPRPQSLNKQGLHAKSKGLSASKQNANGQAKPRLKKLHVTRGAHSPVAANRS